VSGSRFFLVGVQGTELTGRERDLFERHPPGGILLFARNIESERQVRDLVDGLAANVPRVLFAVDQEGGPVDRFRSLAGPSISATRAAKTRASRRAGEIAGALCSSFGIDIDLAPALDRAVPGAGGAVLAERTFSQDPAAIAIAGREFLEGLAEFGIAGCLKHFPGLGRAAVDSHLLLPVIEDDSRQLKMDLLPFVSLAAAPAVMVSHAAIGREALPASLSRAVATDLLRGEAGFSGAAFSDDLEMGALSAFGALPERAAAAFAAGCDLLCIGKENAALPEAAEAVERAVSPRRIAEADERLERLRLDVARIRARKRREPPPLSEIASATEELREKGEAP
jgi:beta-N-acetylhexosaminidase